MRSETVGSFSLSRRSSPVSRRRVPRVAMAAMLATLSPALAPAQRPARAAAVAAVDSIAAVHLADGRAAGLSVAAVVGRDTLVMKGYGSADLELDVPTPLRAIYEVGSMTKQFTAAAVLQLQERGKLSLDDELTKYLPDYPTQGHRVTLRHLLGHTSGITSYTEIEAAQALMGQKFPPDTLVRLFSSEPFGFAPGDALAYSNSGYFLLGRVIEKVGGMSYAEYVKTNLFNQAGMRDSYYCDERTVMKRRAHGYDVDDAGLARAAYVNHMWPYSAGALCSTAGDLVAWTRALHGGGLLSPASYRELITPDTLNDGSRVRYAKGVIIVPIAGHPAIRHGGAIPGFVSDLAYLPDDSTTVVVLVNTFGSIAPEEVTEAIVAAVLGRRPPKTVRFTGDPAAYAGTYRRAGNARGMGISLRITARDGGLAAQLGPGAPTPLTYIGNDTFDAPRNLRLTFVREGGRVTKLRADFVIRSVVLARR